MQGKFERLGALAIIQALVTRDIPPFSSNLSMNLFSISMLQLVQLTEKPDNDLLAALLQTFGATPSVPSACFWTGRLITLCRVQSCLPRWGWAR